MQVYYLYDVQGDIKILHLTEELREGMRINKGKDAVFTKGTKKYREFFNPSNLRMKYEKGLGLSFFSVWKTAEPFYLVPAKAMQRKLEVLPEEYRHCIEWNFDGRLDDHWVLAPNTKNGQLSLKRYLEAASFLYEVAVPPQDQPVPTTSSSSGFRNEDEHILNQIRDRGPLKCLQRLIYEPLGDELFESDDDDSEEEDAPNHMVVQCLRNLLEMYGKQWEKGYERTKTSTELTAEQAFVVRALLVEDWTIYERLVFNVLKHRKSFPKTFDAVGASRKFIEFVCFYAEDRLKHDSLLRQDGPYWNAVLRELLTRHWHNEVNRIQESETSALKWIQRKDLHESPHSIDRSEQDTISVDLREVRDIIDDAHFTVMELSSDEALQMKEQCQQSQSDTIG
jgi:hypothetical protein